MKSLLGLLTPNVIGLLAAHFNHLEGFCKIQIPRDSNHIETPPFLYVYILTPALSLALPFPLILAAYSTFST